MKDQPDGGQAPAMPNKHRSLRPPAEKPNGEGWLVHNQPMASGAQCALTDGFRLTMQGPDSPHPLPALGFVQLLGSRVPTQTTASGQAT
ncbi:hypothetical protein [Synechococcus sp. MIT S1220]|uniref:hypothetical protein n=1 Tax=Synechococcus sp. MIT S1220 TaxID=3082549 RepID=UPI0039AEC490